jgi:hypothetical protein
MTTLSLSNILDDLRAAEEGLHKFEQRYWISSAQFYDLYSQGLLDDGENADDFSEWAGHYRLREKRQAALEQLSQQRMKTLQKSGSKAIHLHPAELTLRLG